MIRAAALLLALAATALGDSLVRARVKPESGARVGQPVTLTVDLMTTTWFSRGARLPELDVKGAVVLRLSSFGINGTETVQETAYTVQSWEYTIYPQRAGRFGLGLGQ